MRRVIDTLRRATADGMVDWMDALLDRRCPGCGSPAPRRRPVCDACDGLVGRSGTALCLRCLSGESPGRSPDPGREAEGIPARGCPRHGPGRLLLAGPAFEPPLDRVLHSFKYEGSSALAPWIASLLPEPPGIADPLRKDYVLVPVSLHPARRAWRGFDQALLMANDASARWGIPVIEALARIRDHEPQARLDPVRRRVNVQGAFTVVRRSVIADRPVLLVDDVATTGSTLLAAAEALERVGAEWVLSLTACHGGDPGGTNRRESFTLSPNLPLC